MIKYLVTICLMLLLYTNSALAMPPIMTTSELKPGMQGYAETVVQGAQQVSFNVEIIGVVNNGKGSSKQILARAYGPIIEETNGVIHGMSGSPVYVDGKLIGAVARAVGLGDTLMLKPDSKACLQKDGRLKVIPVDDYNPYRWKEGLICFRNESFLSIMNDLEKYFGVSIVVENKNVLKYYFTGKFRQADGIDYALRVLQRDIRFKYERDDENQIIYIR